MTASGKYRPLNLPGVAPDCSVPADWRTSTTYYAVPVRRSDALGNFYMTNRGGITAEKQSTWAPSFPH